MCNIKAKQEFDATKNRIQLIGFLDVCGRGGGVRLLQILNFYKQNTEYFKLAYFNN